MILYPCFVYFFIYPFSLISEPSIYLLKIVCILLPFCTLQDELVCVLRAHHQCCCDCVLTERRVNELKKREGLERGSTANSTQEASAGFVYRHSLTFKGKESAFSFPELIQLCGSFSPVLGCVDKELVCFFSPFLIKRHSFIYGHNPSTFSPRVHRPFLEPSLDLTQLKQEH